MKQYKKYYVFAVLFFIIVLLSIGFAYLSTTLNISGTSIIHNVSWDIHFENVQVTSGSVTADEPEIDSLETTVTYDVTLTNPGDFFEFTVDAVNDGTIDAMIGSVTSKLNGEDITDLPSYLIYTVSYSNGNPIKINQKLDAGKTETYKVRVEYKKNITVDDLPQIEQNLLITFGVEYIQTNGSAVTAHPLCRRAKGRHIERCLNEGNVNGYYCGAAGYYNQNMYYGSLGTNGVLSSGDAFDCDVNADGIYDSSTERFYYVSPKDANTNSEYVTLIYYNNVYNGVPDNSHAAAFGGDYTGPTIASTHLPTTSQWSDERLLSNQTRQIKADNGNSYFIYDYDQFNLPIFTYTNCAARLLTRPEIIYACGGTNTSSTGYLDSCNYFMENTRYANKDRATVGFWLETHVSSIRAFYNTFILRNLASTSSNYADFIGVRPAIDVKREDIAY